MNPGCWVAENVIGAGPCDGRLVRAHLIPRQLLKRERLFEWDPRVWVPVCGGPVGIGGHHGMLDHSRTLKIPRGVLPGFVEEFAAENGIAWWLDREYGPKEMAA